MEFTNPARTIHESERRLVVIPEKGRLYMLHTRVTLASLMNSEVKQINCTSDMI